MKKWKQEALYSLVTFVIIFILNAFVVSCSFILFFHYLDYEPAQIHAAAPFTFLNVLVLTALVTIINAVWRYFAYKKPVQKIQASLEKITTGDFEERIDPESVSRSYVTVADSINRMTAELAETQTLKTDFLSNISHEIKTPLAVIRNYAKLLQADAVLDAERKESAGRIDAAAARMNTLISDILRLNRLENSRLQPQHIPVDLSAQLSECLLHFEDVWEEKGIDLQTDIADGVTLCSDPQLLELIWNNLLSNAFKFTENGGTVHVSLTSDANRAAVQIADTGCGIDADTGKHIFDKFYQGDTSHATQGNGLGLALVKRVIDLVGGEISVKSTVGKGSTFTVILQKNAYRKGEYYGE